ncbi:MAG: outer membrane beta-barrel protein [Parafilimonas sp.]
MEGLFREAAKNYRINTEDAVDWERIENAVHESDSKKNEPSESPKNKKRRFMFWYLLLIPLGWFIHYLYTNQFQSKALQKQVLQNNQQAVLQQKNAAPNSQNFNNDIRSKQAKAATNDVVQINKSVFNFSVQTKPNFKFKLPVAASYNNTSSEILSKKINQEIIYNDIPKNTVANQSIEKNNLPLANQSNTEEDEQLKINAITSSTEQKDKASDDAKNNATLKKQGRGFYAGLLFSPDLSFVKFQKIESMGTSFGFIGGYHLNSRWSIETGFLIDRKNYYTKGSYFDKSSLPSPNTVDLLSADGWCNMLEVPLTVKYNFNSKKTKSNFTATLGTSSYFMSKEYYNYNTKENGIISEYDYIYHNSSKNLFGVINVGAGYQKQLGKNFSLRIEPYLKIPISKIGTGNLPISSAGVNLGITKSFH